MQKSYLPPIQRGGKPPKYPQLIKNKRIGDYVTVNSPTEQTGAYHAILRSGKFAAIRTVGNEYRVYIISKADYLSGRKKRGAK